MMEPSRALEFFCIFIWVMVAYLHMEIFIRLYILLHFMGTPIVKYVNSLYFRFGTSTLSVFSVLIDILFLIPLIHFPFNISTSLCLSF